MVLRQRFSRFGLIVIIVFAFQSIALAQSTEFTYQGKLTDGAAGATGTYDFEFRLFPVGTGGSAIGTALKPGVSVTGGLFSVGLDFGAQFDGSARWLEVGVRLAGSGAYTTLTPRIALTSTPYAIRSVTAGQADALSSDPGDCNSGVAAGIAANGAAQGCVTMGSANGISTLVRRDASGNFAAGTITASVAGNATTASALASNPSNCAGGVAAGIAANGDAEGCISVASPNTANAIVLRDGSGNFTAGTITATDVVYGSPQTRYLTISAPAFTPPNSSDGFGSNYSAGNDRYSTGGPRFLAASLSLPHGAQITNLSCKVRDVSATSAVNVGISDGIANFWRCGPTTSATNVGDHATLATSCNLAVDNLAEAYHVRFYPSQSTCSSECSIYSCTITYTTTGPR